ncbi:MAG: insulinase family protein [Deltaproteobacteria bacterium]|nr:insulinase family protein [Deltaproteobacteria bacterium]
MKYELKNGLEVILIENHRAPVTSMLVWVKVGSALEKPNEIGLAHLMEHMLFKGTTTRGPGIIAQEVEGAGGHINAYTSFDQTVYYIDIASRFTERAMTILADMIYNPALDPVEFAREKEVVVEEINRSQDIPARRLTNAVFAEAYRVHPYGRPIIGYADTVRSITREIAIDFHKRWYQPENMILVIAGDFKIDEIKDRVEENFGSKRAVEIDVDNPPAEPFQRETRAVVLREDVKEAQLDIAFHIPAIKNDEVKALDLLAVILGQGRTARLYQEVKRNKELIHEVYASVYTPKDPGLFFIDASLSPDKALPSLKAIIDVIFSLSKAEVQPEELSRAKLKIKADFIDERGTMSGEARTAASFQALLGDYKGKDRYLADIEKVTLADLRNVAQKYLRPENLSVGLIIPKNAPEDVEESKIISIVTEAGPSNNRNEVTKYTLRNGATLLVKADHSLPLVAIRIAFLGGLRFEEPRYYGLNNFLAEVWDKGTKNLSAEELATAIEDMAGEISAFSGRNSFGLEAEFLSQFLDPGLDLLVEVLVQPAMDPSEVKKARPNILAAIKRQADQLTYRTFNLFGKTIYGEHPYAANLLGTPESVNLISADTIRDYYEKWAVPANMIVTVVGDVEPNHIKARFEELLGNWKENHKFIPPVIKAPTALKELKTAREEIQRAQAHLFLGFLTPGLESEERYSLEVLDRLLSGQGGRLFIDLRDKQSLAYTVSSLFRPGLGTGTFGFYIAFAPSKYDQVKAGLTKVISDLNDISPEELNRAKYRRYKFRDS